MLGGSHKEHFEEILCEITNQNSNGMLSSQFQDERAWKKPPEIEEINSYVIGENVRRLKQEEHFN